MRLIFALMLAASLSLSLSCQQTPASSPTPAPTAEPTLAPDAPSREQVLKLIEVMQMRKQMQAMVKTMQNSMDQMRKSQMADLSPKQQTEMRHLQNDLYDSLFSEDTITAMLEQIIPIYQHHFTKSDVDALISFYSTPVGQKLLQEQPQIMQEYMPKVMGDMQDRIKAAMKQLHYEERLKTIMHEDDAADEPAATQDQDSKSTDPNKTK